MLILSPEHHITDQPFAQLFQCLASMRYCVFGLLPQQLQAESDSDSDGAYERLVSLDADSTAALRCVASCNAVLLSVSHAKHHQLCEGFATSLQGFEYWIPAEILRGRCVCKDFGHSKDVFSGCFCGASHMSRHSCANSTLPTLRASGPRASTILPSVRPSKTRTSRPGPAQSVKRHWASIHTTPNAAFRKA